jgi:hypothetical protein
MFHELEGFIGQALRTTPPLIGESICLICSYLPKKNWKLRNSSDVNKRRYDYSMNSAQVVI